MAKVRRWVIACFALAVLLVHGGAGVLAQTTAPATAPAAATQPVPAAVVVLKGVVDEYSQETLLQRFEQAKAQGAKTVILQLNTPGGLVSAAESITSYLREQHTIHTVAFVDHKALSAGIMIGLSCDELVMAPSSLIGDCAPIMMTSSGELQSLGAAERAKAESPILADFYASSVRNGYDPLLTQSMVTMGRVVRYLQNPDGTAKKFVDEKDAEPLIKEGWKPVEGIPDPVDKADTLLTVDSNLAEKLGLSKGTYATPEAFAAARGFAISQTLAPRTSEKIVSWLGSPVVRGILIVVLLQAIYFAFGHPGHLWPEAIGIGTLLLLLGIPMMTGFANWLEVIAIILGLVLLALEVFVIPGFGVAGVAGLILLFGGLVMTFVGNEPNLPGIFPTMRGTWINLQRGLFVVTAGLACSLVLWIWLNRYLPRLPYFNKLILTATTGDINSIAADRPIETGPAIGDTGIAVTDLRPGGSVKFMTESYPDGRIAAVISDSGYVPEGTKVVVYEVAGNRVVVRTTA
jgi:membrane-bound serine protease (ClpP class)